jgi:hypothetical protein
MSKWIERARIDLLELRDSSGAWGYRTDRGPSVEATALACLGLLSCSPGDGSGPVLDAVRRGAGWLVGMQNLDGSLGVSPASPHPGWTTPYAILLWRALERYGQERRRAAAWLLGQKGTSLPVADPTQSIIGHDSSLVGWPWVDGTHSWIEPTALAILALSGEGLGDHPRVDEGMLVITDRALPHGGWNCGNKTVFRRELRPQPGPTGLALLALATRTRKVRPRAVDPAIAYLCRTLVDVRAPISLGWGVLGLRAWAASPPEADAWLGQSYADSSGRRDSTVGLALLLLAGGERASAYFGARAVNPAARRRMGNVQAFVAGETHA